MFCFFLVDGCPFDACTAHYDPVCGSDGVSYTNECWLNVAICRDSRITFRHEGICTPLPPGRYSLNNDPMCGSNGVHYANECCYVETAG